LNQAFFHVDVWGSGGMPPLILTSALASHPCPSTIGNHWIRGRVDLRAGVDGLEKSRLHLPGIEPRYFRRQARIPPL
jgi:hypothetical protein